MELFLNLCWLSLLVPAALLWRQRKPSSGASPKYSPTGPAGRPFVLLCTLGCAFVLLFPVISATDDLHAMRPEMDESERAFRRASHCECSVHALAHPAQPSLLVSVCLTNGREQIGKVLPVISQSPGLFSAAASASRAPPLQPTSL
jgi:hypothetical protein